MTLSELSMSERIAFNAYVAGLDLRPHMDQELARRRIAYWFPRRHRGGEKWEAYIRKELWRAIYTAKKGGSKT